MKIIPAISLMHDRIAIVENGRYEYLQNENGQFRSPVNIVRELPGDEIFIMDIDGLERNSPNLKTVKKLAAYKNVWLDAGTPDALDMMDLFVSDASEVIMGTKALYDLDQLKQAAELSENVIFSIDYDNAVLSPNNKIAGMSVDDILISAKALKGLDTVIFMDLGSHRDKTPVDLNIISNMCKLFEKVYVSAHIIPDDYPILEEAGITGIIRDFRTIETVPVDAPEPDDNQEEENE